MSPSKTSIITCNVPFGKSKFYMDGCLLKEETHIKHLGCFLSRNGSSKEHSKHLLNKLDSAIKGLIMIGLKSTEYSISTSVKLFNSIALPSALYGTETLPMNLSTIKSMDIKARRFFKHILICSRTIPNDILYGPKIGYDVPIATWLRNDLYDFAKETFSNSESKIIDTDFLIKKLNQHKASKANYAPMLWKSLILCTWLKMYESKIRLGV